MVISTLTWERVERCGISEPLGRNQVCDTAGSDTHVEKFLPTHPIYYRESENMLMTKYPNKVQEYAAKVGIVQQVDLRKALAPYGIAEATARTVWIGGANKRLHYELIEALEKVLKVEADKFLEQ